MEQTDRPDGWTLIESISELQVEVFRFVFAASAKSGFQRDHGRQVAWEGIAPQLERGDLHATGFRPRGTVPEAIDPFFAAAAVPDFGKNTLSLNETVYAGVKVWRGAGAGGTPKPERRSRAPLEAGDMKLFPEWERLVAGGLTKWAAAAKLAAVAQGGGVEESKTKRLHNRFTQLKSSTQF